MLDLLKLPNYRVIFGESEAYDTTRSIDTDALKRRRWDFECCWLGLVTKAASFLPKLKFFVLEGRPNDRSLKNLLRI